MNPACRHPSPAIYDQRPSTGDAFLLEEQLTGQERMLRDGARAFAEDRLQPRVLNDFAKETADPNVVFRAMGEAGLFGITLPEEYGGLGASHVTYGLAGAASPKRSAEI